MGEHARQWGEKEWQSYANGLLSTHYNLFRGSYQRIPDLGGDHGLEGISDCGDAYQCYADQGSKDNDERTRKQKKKIREDLAKLETYKDFWVATLGTRKILRWTLMVPDFDDKEVLKYARKKGRELLAKNLPYIDPSFQVFVKNADDFPSAKLIAREPRLPKGSGPPVTPDEIEAFKKSNPGFVQRIDEKLRKVLGKQDDAARGKYLEKLLRWHLDSSNFVDDLHAKFPPEWEDLHALITRKGESIETENFIVRGPAHQRLAAVRKEFAETLRAEHKFLDEGDRELVSWGTVSKWLGECPLDFPEGCDA
jgi:hypothetical protein